MSTKSHTQKALEHETSPQHDFILRPTTAYEALTRFHQIKRLRIPRLRTRIRLPAVSVTPPRPGKRFPLVRMQVTVHFWTRAQIRSHSTDKNEPLTIEQVRELLNKNK